jgi:hypothetical protein
LEAQAIDSCSRKQPRYRTSAARQDRPDNQLDERYGTGFRSGLRVAT